MSLSKAQSSLPLFKSKFDATNSVLSNAKLATVLDSKGSSTAWMKLCHIADLQRPITIEIGILENRNASLSGLLQTSRSFYALLKHKKF